MTILSIDIGGTNFRIGTIQENGSAVKFEKVPTKSVICSEDVVGDLAAYPDIYQAECY